MVFLDTSNIISADGTSPVGRLSGSNSNDSDYILFVSIFSGMYLGPFCNDTELVTLRMRAVAAAMLLSVFVLLEWVQGQLY